MTLFTPNNSASPIIDFEGENAILQTTSEEYTDPEYGTVIGSDTNETSIKCIFEEISEEEAIQEPGTVQRYDARAYISNSTQIQIEDRIKRFPNTSNEIIYEAMEINEYTVYKQVELKKIA